MAIMSGRSLQQIYTKSLAPSAARLACSSEPHPVLHARHLFGFPDPGRAGPSGRGPRFRVRSKVSSHRVGLTWPPVGTFMATGNGAGSCHDRAGTDQVRAPHLWPYASNPVQYPNVAKGVLRARLVAIRRYLGLSSAGRWISPAPRLANPRKGCLRAGLMGSAVRPPTGGWDEVVGHRHGILPTSVRPRRSM